MKGVGASLAKLEKGPSPTSAMMRVLALLLVTLVCTAVVAPAQAGSTEAGVDINPDEADVPFSVLERTTPSQDGNQWTLSLQLDQEAMDNGTTMAITTQICLNNGVCDPPVAQEAEANNGVYTMDLTPPSDHTYVNWRVKTTYSDDSTETFPNGEWYKTWSTCYYDDGRFGGVHAEDDGCNVPLADSEESALPALGAVVGIMAVGLAAAVVVRRS